ncbi:DNA replication licensing factor mcm8, partial [Quaeritorhiza haematococci]
HIGQVDLVDVEDDGRTLAERLKVGQDEVIDPIPPSLLRKYVAYAKRWSQPYRSVDAIPITTRQLESLIRLSEARARAEMKDEVTPEHARDVIEIMKHSLWESYQDEMGQVDFSRSQHGTGMSRKGEPKR